MRRRSAACSRCQPLNRSISASVASTSMCADCSSSIRTRSSQVAARRLRRSSVSSASSAVSLAAPSLGRAARPSATARSASRAAISAGCLGTAARLGVVAIPLLSGRPAVGGNQESTRRAGRQGCHTAVIIQLFRGNRPPRVPPLWRTYSSVLDGILGRWREWRP